MTDFARPGQPWDRVEIRAVVRAYVAMLQKELRGERYSKSEAVRALAPSLPARSRGSIELKLQNVSAILEESGLDWIDGYKPMSHYQSSLRDEVVEQVVTTHGIGEQLAAYETAAVAPAMGRPLATSDVLAPTPTASGSRGKRSNVSLTGSPLSAMRDFQRRQLGRAGERWVLDLEREQLSRSGRPDLANQVRWVADLDGDGAGYDILSFRPDGRERWIEVKTTNLGARTPFYITRWEIEVSAGNPEAFSLFRVHGFVRDPRIYVLDGSVKDLASLEPKVYLGIPL